EALPYPDNKTPAAFAIVSYSQNGTTSLDTTVPGQAPANDFTLYVESSGDFSSSQALSARSAISIANPSDSVVYVTLELRDLQGNRRGLSTQLQIPPRGHTGAFLHEIVGFIDMPQEFEGILHVTATGPGITMYSLRARYNESGQFIATTTG